MDDGLVKVSVGQKSAFVPSPDTSRGHWTSVEVEMTPDGITTIIDAIYSVVRFVVLKLFKNDHKSQATT